MEIKKHPEADLERRSGLFLNIGLCISLLLVITAFEWRFYDRGAGMDLGTIEDFIESKKISIILDWLRQNVHHYGRSLDSEELVKKVTGTKLSPDYFLDYLDNKVEKLSTICE